MNFLSPTAKQPEAEWIMFARVNSVMTAIRSKKSAGILMYRKTSGFTEFLLVHPGGPFYRNKDQGAWSIPKGEYTPDEDPQQAAIREFEEELGFKISGSLIKLNPVTQKAGKEVSAWAVEGDFDPAHLISNTFSLEWPPKSNQTQNFPEVDKAEWMDLKTAKFKINAAQIPLLEELEEWLVHNRDPF